MILPFQLTTIIESESAKHEIDKPITRWPLRFGSI